MAALVHLRLQSADKREALEEWMSGIFQACKSWRSGSWLGRVILSPKPGDLDYLVVFRFRTLDLMQGWLASSTRQQWLTKLREENIAHIISSDVQQGSVIFTPEPMMQVAWNSLTGQTIAEEEVKPKKRAPPPKWRTGFVIWVSLWITVIPWFYYVMSPMTAAGISLELRLVLTLVPIVMVVKWFLLPVLDKMFHCFLVAPRCKCPCLPAGEPCTSLQDGCICCRPGAPKVDKSVRQLEMLEKQMLEMRRHNGLVRCQLMNRIERLEQEQSMLADSAEGINTSALVDHETTALIEEGSKATAASAKGASALEVSLDVASNDSASDDPVTICIRYRVKEGSFFKFQEWVQEIARVASTRVEGHRGALVITRPKSEPQNDAAPTHVIVFQYDKEEHLKAWAQHPQRHALVNRLQYIIKHEVTELDVVGRDSINDLFHDPQSEEIAAQHDMVDGPRRDPQFWKMGIIIATNLWIVIYFFSSKVGHAVGSRTALWLGVVASTGTNVACLTYFMMPVAIWLCRAWVFQPWRESRNCCVALCQRGFPCWDNVGKMRRMKRIERV